MSAYVNRTRHAIVLPGGQPVEPRGVVDLDSTEAEPLVADGLLQAAPDGTTTKAKSRKEARS